MSTQRTKTIRKGETVMVPIFRKMEIGSVVVDPKGDTALEVAALHSITGYVDEQIRNGAGEETSITDSFVFEYGSCRVAVQLGDAVDA